MVCFIRFWQQGEKYVSKPEDRLYDMGMTSEVVFTLMYNT